jgi:hypothetical protein
MTRHSRSFVVSAAVTVVASALATRRNALHIPRRAWWAAAAAAAAIAVNAVAGNPVPFLRHWSLVRDLGLESEYL